MGEVTGHAIIIWMSKSIARPILCLVNLLRSQFCLPLDMPVARLPLLQALLSQYNKSCRVPPVASWGGPFNQPVGQCFQNTGTLHCKRAPSLQSRFQSSHILLFPLYLVNTKCLEVIPPRTSPVLQSETANNDL